MPFAELPGSPGFTPPQAPSWAPFAAQAVDLIGHQPVINTAELVQNAVGQINKILEMSSPEARLEREMKMTQMQAMREVYANYREHPEKYQMTTHGPVLIDPVARFARIANINHTIESTKALHRKNNLGVPVWISNKASLMEKATAADKQGVIKTGDTRYEAIGGTTTETGNTNTEDSTDETLSNLSAPLGGSAMGDPFGGEGE